SGASGHSRCLRQCRLEDSRPVRCRLPRHGSGASPDRDNSYPRKTVGVWRALLDSWWFWVVVFVVGDVLFRRLHELSEIPGREGEAGVFGGGGHILAGREVDRLSAG